MCARRVASVAAPIPSPHIHDHRFLALRLDFERGDKRIFGDNHYMFDFAFQLHSDSELQRSLHFRRSSSRRAGMARQGFKKRWIAVVPEPIERSTFVHLSGAILWLLFWQWRPNTVEVWRIDNPIGSELLYAIYFIGWGIVLLGTFLINHANLFGLRQVADYWLGREPIDPGFQTPLLYTLSADIVIVSRARDTRTRAISTRSA